MDRVPPRIVRRVVVAPVVMALCLALLAVSPAFIALALIADVVTPHRWRATRLVLFGVTYLALEIGGLLVLFALWIASGFGATIRSPRMRERHYAFMRWLLHRIYRATAVLFHARIEVVDPQQPRPGPVLVFSRHAGPGNSLGLIVTMMSAFGRQPRIIMLAKLQWDPLFDTLLNRLPNRFIRHDPSKRDVHVRAIEELASGLGDRDAFVLFPEGHDFTPSLRRRAIAHLRRKGRHEEADKAERMRNVLPPKYRGVQAAMSGAPEADVVFVAHTVLEDVGSFGEFWKALPLESPIEGRYWRVPPDEVPRDNPEALIDWLYDWWRRIDEWIDERRIADELAAAQRRA